jgi:hypothetical protein
VVEEAYILFVRKNALQVLIPKYGIEGNIFLREITSRSKFDDEVCCSFKNIGLSVNNHYGSKVNKCGCTRVPLYNIRANNGLIMRALKKCFSCEI